MNIFNFSLLIALLVRVYTHLLSILALNFITFKPSFPYWDAILNKLGPTWYWLWGNFDGVHYLKIVKEGYANDLTQAFFPAYPLLIRLFNHIIPNPLTVGLIISHLSLVGFIYYFIKLGRLDYSKKIIFWSTAFLLIFPTSFFLFGVYTESLFLLLTASSLFYARKQKFLLAGCLAGLASATRLVGIFLLPAILWEYFRDKSKRTKLKVIGLSFLSASGLISYLVYLQIKFHDWLIFVNSQSAFGAGRQTEKFVLIYQVIFRYLKMLLTVDPNNQIFFSIVLEFLVAIIFIGLIIYALVKKFRPSYLIFIIPSFILPTLTGTFLSIPRFALGFFPLFYLFGSIKSKPIKIILLIISFILFTISFLRFGRGYWVA